MIVTLGSYFTSLPQIFYTHLVFEVCVFYTHHNIIYYQGKPHSCFNFKITIVLKKIKTHF